MKKHKVLEPILLILLFFVVFLGCFAYWKVGWWHSSAAEGESDSTTTGTEIIDVDTVIDHNTDQTLMAVNTTFYNYLYDKEIYDNVRDQGAQGCFDTIYEDGKVKQLIAIPYGAFDSKLSDYYKINNVKSGIYTGNFYNYYGGLPGVEDKKIPFPGYYYFPWAANIANRTPDYDSVCQGIVCKDLDGFTSGDEKSGTLMTSTSTDDKVVVPYFDSNFLDNKVEVTKASQPTQVPIGVVKENVYFPFRKIKTGSKAGYYEFDSTKDVVRFKGMQTSTPPNYKYYFGVDDNSRTAKLEYEYYEEDHNNKVYSMASKKPQFLPFNTGNYEFMGVETEKLTGTDRTNAEAKKLACQEELDYGFGVRYNIPFYLSSDGKVDGKNMVFEFSGDDDVWVFLDGKLVMDLGGQHGKASGTIDFGGTNTTAKVTIANVTYVKDDKGITSNNATDTATSNMILQKDTTIKSNVTNTITGIEKGDTHKHIITVFYLERGMLESNFHMAFNFVPAHVSKPEATPEPTPESVQAGDKYKGTLKIQNEVVFPTIASDTDDDEEKDKINATFLDTVKDLAEDDVFQYLIANKGTNKDNVGDSEINYPSGKLTVRENGSDDPDVPKKTSYLSFGAESKVRIYVDLGSFETAYNDYFNVFKKISNVKFSFDNMYNDNDLRQNDKNGNFIINYLKVSGAKEEGVLYHYGDKIFYFDMLTSTASFSIEMQVRFNGIDGTPTIKALYQNVSPPDGKTWADCDGKIYLKIKEKKYEHDLITITEYQWTTTNNLDLPALGGGTEDYSEGLPYQTVGPVATFSPANETELQNVSKTSYEITEAHLAPTMKPNDTSLIKIKKNSETTSGITGSDGSFNLFYDDSATFKKQFAAGSQMKVVQQDTLWKPVRNGNNLTNLSARGEGEKRTVSEYYYTTVKAESRGTGTDNNSDASAEINVSYDGNYNFSNAEGITGDVDIVQTFTNTIKTGSLTISKELKGNMEADNSYQYGFKVTFSNVFGGSSGESVYKGDCSYTLVKEDGTKTTKDVKDVKDEIIELKPNEKAIISGIPVGTTYKIEEVNIAGNAVNDGSVVSKIQTRYVAEVEGEKITSPTYTATSTEAGIEVNKGSRTISGAIPCSVVNKSYGTATNEFSEVNVSVAYTNQFGALTITKNIAGDTKNVSYYYDDTTKEKTYTFKVTVNDANNTPYKGNYKIYTYDYSAGTNKPPKVTTDTKPTTDGTITLLNGQMAEIGGIKLTDNLVYTITEQIDETDIYFVESLKVTSGTPGSTIKTTGSDSITDNTKYNTEIKTQIFDSSQPTFDVIYTNRYSDAYIEIDKFIDNLYYGDKKYADYADDKKTDIAYQDLTNAKQSFIFKVKQYKTLADAQNDNDCEGSFDIVLSMKDDNTETLTGEAVVKGDNVDYTYKNSKTIKVLANRYYRIEEDTDWSWKYELKNVQKEDTNNGSSVVNNKNVVILKTYLDALNQIKDGKVIPIAKFYNALDSDKKDIEGDTDSIPNIIKKE